MRVVMNGLATLKQKTGVGHYIANLSAALATRSDVRLTLYPRTDYLPLARYTPRVAGGNNGGKEFRIHHASQVIKHFGKIAAGVHFAGMCRADGYDLYHEPNFIPLPTDLPTVVTVHDLSVLLSPQWHPADRVKHHERHFLRSVRRAEHVVAVSKQVRDELVSTVGLDSNRVTAIHNGISGEFRPQPDVVTEECRRRHLLPEKYMLYVGTVEPRKNVLSLLKAFTSLEPTIRARCPLVLAGPWGWKSDTEQDFFSAHAEPAGVRRLGYVPAGDLPAIYSAASTLLYPSWYEGFGLPPVEMLACGRTVVYSQEAAAVREVVGEFGTALPANDIDAWRDVMTRIATTDNDFSWDRVAFASQYSWERAASQTREVYHRIVGQTSTRRVA
jgi:glycosyltransferase involved in cell wall biosynthesis